jgi:Leucine-rich repeat (LRR) protein
MTFNDDSYFDEEIGTLTNLEKLSFANNQLKELPAELGNLKKLEGITISCS